MFNKVLFPAPFGPTWSKTVNKKKEKEKRKRNKISPKQHDYFDQDWDEHFETMVWLPIITGKHTKINQGEDEDKWEGNELTPAAP